MIGILKSFHSIAQKTPQKTAVVDEGGRRKTSYSELDDMSGRAASWLLKKGIGKEDVAAICVPRGVRFAAVRLAVMKIGAAWVGVEDMMGRERISYIIKDSGAAIVVDDAGFDEALLESPLPPEKWADPDPHDMAFIFYTSGSTGRPKGVVQEYGIYEYIASSTYRCIKDYIPANYANIGPETFIGGIHLMAGNLSVGNTLHLIPLELVRDPEGLLDYFKKHEISASCMPPTLVKALEKAGGLDLKILHITGEIAVDLYIDRFPVMNAYGPTEFSYLPFFFDLDHAYSNTPIGTPDEDTRLLLADENGSIRKDEGALCIKLPYFRGYLHDEDRSSFIEINGETWFRNGDYVSVDENGVYTLLGRIDDMVKINGNRIEPAEVEYAVRKVLNTDFAAVKTWERNGSRYLCAYHTTASDPDPADMAEKLKGMLPSYMIPSCYVRLEKIPLNENGKVDKRSLPEPDANLLFAAFAAPENEMQKKLCTLFAKVLGISRREIGLDDDFFLIGGNSLSAIELVAQAGIPALSVPMIFEQRTVRNIEPALSGKKTCDDAEPAEKSFPLSDEQLYFLGQEMKLEKNPVFNLPVMLSLKKETDDAALQEALKDVFTAHPALLTVIEKTDNGFIQRYEPQNSVTVQVQELSEEELEVKINGFVKPFSFDGKPLFRCSILRTPERLVLLFDVHHIICDGYSLKIVAEDILSALDGKKIQNDHYFQYMHEQTFPSDPGRKEKDSRYFLNKYKDDCDCLPKRDLPGTVSEEGSLQMILPVKTGEVKKAAGRLHLSESSLYLLASALALAGYNDTDRVMLSWNYNGRSEMRTMRTAGLLIRDYPAAFSIKEDDTAASLVRALNSQLRDAIIHGSVSPFMNRGSKELLCFLYQKDLYDIPESPYLLDVDYPEFAGKGAIEPLELKICEEGEEVQIELTYDSGIYLPESMERFERIYENICLILVRENCGNAGAFDIIGRAVEETP